MADKRIWKQNERVALAADIKYRGYIHTIANPYNPGDQHFYYVQWDKNAMYLYAADALISEKEANEIQAKSEPDKSTIEKLGDIANKVVDKFKKMAEK